MQDPVNSVIVFLAMCASAAAGFFVHTRLPEEHRSAQSVALLQIAITLLVTFTAIVLGLLTNSVKQGFDDAYAARGDDAAQLAELDRCLRDYGPGTADIRHALQAYTAAVIASTWPDEPRPIGVAFPDPVENAADRQILGALGGPGQRRARDPVASARGRGARTAFGRVRSAISRLAAGEVEGDRGRPRLDLAAVLLGAGVLAGDSVRLLRPDARGRIR